jgi:NAD(P)-dependent dehydrogenase (short-subunit alcohol dehydrogenase family)
MNAPFINDPEKNAQFLAAVPLGRWGQPRDIGALACYLCGEAASFITGTDIVIDGGWLAK